MTTETAALARYAAAHTSASLEEMPLDWIEPSPLNPRRRFSEESLQELADSIKSHGLLEPLVVRPIYRDNDEQATYIIIAGERRYRAAKLAGLQAVPVRILTGVDERRHVELALLENLQRQDLDPLEESAGYRALSELGYTQTQIAAAVKRSQPVVARIMSLLALPEDVQERIRAGELTPSHGTFIAARFRAFPKVASALAQLAVEERYTTDRLERMEGIWWRLVNHKVVRSVEGYGRLFDKVVCETCPFGAYMHGHCLKPAHFDELQGAAEKVEKARVAAALAEARAGGKAIPMLSTLIYDSYVNLGHDWQKPPLGCMAACPCRGSGIESDGRLVPICTDAKGRYATLKTAADREKNAAAKARLREDQDRVSRLVGAVSEIGSREMALLLATIMASMDAPSVRAAALAVAPDLAGAKLTDYQTYDTRPALLATCDPLTLLKLAVESILRHELKRANDFGDAVGKTPWWNWYDADPLAALAEVSS